MALFTISLVAISLVLGALSLFYWLNQPTGSLEEQLAERYLFEKHITEVRRRFSYSSEGLPPSLDRINQKYIKACELCEKHDSGEMPNDVATETELLETLYELEIAVKDQPLPQDSSIYLAKETI